MDIDAYNPLPCKTQGTAEQMEICPGLNANEIQIPHGKHHFVPSLVQSHQGSRFIYVTLFHKINIGREKYSYST